MTNFSELIDLDNNVVGHKARAGCEDGDYIRFVHVFLFDDGGNMLVHQRHHNKSNRPNLLDCSAGGYVEIGESFEDAAYRELEEEISVSKSQVKLKFCCDSWGDYGICKVFTGNYKGSFSANEGEVKTIEFKPLEDVKWLHQKFPYLVNNGFTHSFARYLWTKGEEFEPSVEITDPRKNAS